ncbi:hypothetical protein HMI55_004571 [Coelomomyces lativittatus]|nr:hypothetical protein HMI55_004571 [Coelomomyces lativittatus]
MNSLPLLLFKSHSSALSSHRLQKLLQSLPSFISNDYASTTSWTTHWIYVVYLSEMLTTTTHETFFKLLSTLLQATFLSEDVSLDSPNAILVYPRLGTLSSWSTKATDITRVCGLGSWVRRVERGVLYEWTSPSSSSSSSSSTSSTSSSSLSTLASLFMDPMLETVFTSPFPSNFKDLLHRTPSPRPLVTFPLLQWTRSDETLLQLNQQLGLGLSLTELHYLREFYLHVQRDPTDAELMMYAQVNSEHCRHKLFNATWEIDQEEKKHTLFGMYVLKEIKDKRPKEFPLFIFFNFK